jgi:lipoyl(octanoyl) transferase
MPDCEFVFAGGIEEMQSHAQTCWEVNVGLVPHAKASELQRRCVAARKACLIPDVLLLCEHPHVITLGRNGRRENLLAGDHLLRQMNVEFCSTDRGGDITYHGPGQLIGYPIVDLAAIRRDVRWYACQLEEVMIRAAAFFGISAGRSPGKIGVWVGASSGSEKLGALGVHLSRWVTSHGFAFNVSTDLRYFDLIVPCGIADCRATSLGKLLARPVKLAGVTPVIAELFGEIFGREMHDVGLPELEEALERAEINDAVPVAV